MRRTKKWLAIGMSVAMLFGVAACGKDVASTGTETKQSSTATETGNKTTEAGSESKVEEKEPVTLEWWYRGNGIQKDTEKVEEEFNKLLQTFSGMEHVTVNLNCYDSASYKQAVILAQSAGQQIDILNTVNLTFAEEVEKGSFIALDDYLAENEALYNELPEWLWDLGSVDGSVYMVPNYQRAANMNYFVTPKEYMDKYGDIDKFKEVFNDGQWTLEEAAELLEEYILAVQAGEGNTKYGYPFGYNAIDVNGLLDRNDKITGNYYIKAEGSDKVEHKYLTEDAVKSFEIAADWYERGLIHPDVLTIDNYGDFGNSNMLNDVAFVYTFKNFAGEEERAAEYFTTSLRMDCYAIALYPNYYIQSVWAAGGNGVTATCENPEEAVRLIELMTTEEGTELYNMIVYGLEGVHYEKIDDTHIKTLEYDSTQGASGNSYAGIKWILGNTFHAYLNQGCADGDNEVALAINESPDNVKSDLTGFNAKVDSISSYLDQVNSVTKEYSKVLETGAMGSEWKDFYDEFVKKMDGAGHQEILKELQTQVDAHLAK